MTMYEFIVDYIGKGDYKLEELELKIKKMFILRVEALETADFPVWKAGYVTQRGEIVKFDLDGDGVLDYCMYAGGRSETSLSIGKINGWYKVTSTGTKTDIITRNSDGTYTLTPYTGEA